MMLPVKTGLSATEIVERMKGFDSLDGWGVLVAYDETALEAVVPGSSKMIKYRDVTLGSPLMKLDPRAGLIHLFFSIGGWYTNPDGAAEAKFDDGVFLDVTAKLVTTMGRAGSPQAPVGTVQVFEDAKDSTCDVAIDLSNPLMEMTNKNYEPLFALADVATALTDYISSVGLNYRLSTLKNSSSTGSVTLKPKEFVMTVVEAKDGNAGALLTWISVEGAKSKGTLPSENEKETLVFSRKADDLCNVNPIPKGANACVIVSQEVFGTLFVKGSPLHRPQHWYLGYNIMLTLSPQAQIEKLHYEFKFGHTPPPGETDNPKIPGTGLPFEAKPPAGTIKLDEINHGVWGGEHIDAVSFDMNSSACKFFIDKSSSYASLEYVVSGVNYYRHDVIQYGRAAGTPIRRDGTAKFTFKAKGDGKWQASGNEGFAVSFALPSNFTVSADPDASSFLSKLFLGATDTKLASMEHLSVAVPNTSVDLGSIQLFLTTNILLPGAHIFKLRSLPDNLYMPHDVYLVGDI